MLVNFPDVRLLPAVLVPVVAERYHLVVDVVEISTQRIVPLNGVVSVNDFNPTAMFLNYIGDMVEQSLVRAWEYKSRIVVEVIHHFRFVTVFLYQHGAIGVKPKVSKQVRVHDVDRAIDCHENGVD